MSDPLPSAWDSVCVLRVVQAHGRPMSEVLIRSRVIGMDTSRVRATLNSLTEQGALLLEDTRYAAAPLN